MIPKASFKAETLRELVPYNSTYTECQARLLAIIPALDDDIRYGKILSF